MENTKSLHDARRAAKFARAIAAATPEAIARKRAAVDAIAAELAFLENNFENERARFARALYVKRMAALARMTSAAKFRA